MKISSLVPRATAVLRGKWMTIRNFKSVSIGKKTEFKKNAYAMAESNGLIKMGERCRVQSNSRIVSIGGEVLIGDCSFFNTNNCVISRKKITIGNKCSFGPGVSIYDHDHKFGKNGMEEGYNLAEVVIGNNCWIGANVVILRGTKIGDNCVIGAGCIVKGEVPDNTLLVPETKNKYISLQEKFEQGNDNK